MVSTNSVDYQQATWAFEVALCGAHTTLFTDQVL